MTCMASDALEDLRERYYDHRLNEVCSHSIHTRLSFWST